MILRGPFTRFKDITMHNKACVCGYPITPCDPKKFDFGHICQFRDELGWGRRNDHRPKDHYDRPAADGERQEHAQPRHQRCDPVRHRDRHHRLSLVEEVNEELPKCDEVEAQTACCLPRQEILE